MIPKSPTIQAKLDSADDFDRLAEAFLKPPKELIMVP